MMQLMLIALQPPKNEQNRRWWIGKLRTSLQVALRVLKVEGSQSFFQKTHLSGHAVADHQNGSQYGIDMCYNLSATEFRDFCPCNCYFWRTGKGFSQLPVVAAENENDLQNASIIAAEVRAREAPKPVALAPFVGSTTAPWTGEYTNMAVEILYPICPMSHLFKTFCASHKTFELNMFCMF